jgi:hypothetical protein
MIDIHERTNMTKIPLLKRALARILIIALAAASLPQIVVAAPVDTGVLLQNETAEAQVLRVQETLAREDVRSALVALGVDPVAARERVASLTPAELAGLEGELEQLPAGGDFFAVVGIVFVVLIILELTGVTNIFTKL